MSLLSLTHAHSHTHCPMQFYIYIYILFCNCSAVPAGAVTEMYGPSGGGKTLLCHWHAARVAAAGGRVAWLDAAGGFDPARLVAALGGGSGGGSNTAPASATATAYAQSRDGTSADDWQSPEYPVMADRIPPPPGNNVDHQAQAPALGAALESALQRVSCHRALGGPAALLAAIDALLVHGAGGHAGSTADLVVVDSVFAALVSVSGGPAGPVYARAVGTALRRLARTTRAAVVVLNGTPGFVAGAAAFAAAAANYGDRAGPRETGPGVGAEVDPRRMPPNGHSGRTPALGFEWSRVPDRRIYVSDGICTTVYDCGTAAEPLSPPGAAFSFTFGPTGIERLERKKKLN
jgi:RecA/RadA recombinase